MGDMGPVQVGAAGARNINLVPEPDVGAAQVCIVVGVSPVAVITVSNEVHRTADTAVHIQATVDIQVYAQFWLDDLARPHGQRKPVRYPDIATQQIDCLRVIPAPIQAHDAAIHEYTVDAVVAETHRADGCLRINVHAHRTLKVILKGHAADGWLSGYHVDTGAVR